MGEIPWSILISILHRWVWIGPTLGVQYHWGVDRTDPWGPSRNGPSAIGPQLFGSSAVVWYVMCPKWTMILLTGLYGWDSMVDIDINPSSIGSNIWRVDRTDPWGPEMDHPPLGRSYLVVVPSYDMSCALILLTGIYGWDNWALWVRFHGRYWYQSFIDGSNIWRVDRTDPWGPENWTIRRWAAAIWYLVVVPSWYVMCVVWYVMCPDSLNWALWVRFHGRYWYQSFIDGSNIWREDRTDPWGPSPPLGRSYLK